MGTDYQMTNYGVGGLCEDHTDPYGYEEGVPLTDERSGMVTTGDFMATVMGWLTDTAAGGATTFFLGSKPVKLWPTRRAAGFWFSMSTNGWRDGAVGHGACPVLVGSKWIVNKWIHSFNQWTRHPCDRVPGGR